MNGLIKQTAAALCFGAAFFTAVGCSHYRDIVDPCWPERYNYIARNSVRDMHNAQADKGHILNQTLWNEDFEGEKLKPSGIARLKYIANREPTPMLMKLYLQNAEIPYDGDGAKTVREQERVNEARKKAIHAFLATQTAARSGTVYQVDVHDYVQPTYPAPWTESALENIQRTTKTGTLQQFQTPATSGK